MQPNPYPPPPGVMQPNPYPLPPGVMQPNPYPPPPGAMQLNPYLPPPPAYHGNPQVVVNLAKSPGVAAILSFFWCGVGQIYNGEIGKGIAFMVCFFFSCFLVLFAIGFFTTPILWIAGIYDAYKTAERLNLPQGRPALIARAG
jgi:TM2 domain-containing membrane protein YozV